MDDSVFSGLTLIDKGQKIQYSMGLGCQFTATFRIDDTDKEVLHSKTSSIIVSFLENPFPAVGYITLRKSSDEVLVYYNYSNWLVFLTIVSSRLLDHFLNYNKTVSVLRSVLDDNSKPETMLHQLQEKLFPDRSYYACNDCSEDSCVTGSLNRVLVHELKILNQ